MSTALRIVQATSPAPAAGAGSTFKLVKPLGGQAIVVPIAGDIKIDLSDIANETISFVRAGDKLIVVFDNQSTATIGPVFDAEGRMLPGVTFQVGPDRELTGAEFASLFAIATDLSVLPAADGGTSSGAYFVNPHVDALRGGDGPQALLGDEDRGGTGAGGAATGALAAVNRPPAATDDGFEASEADIATASAVERLLVGNLIGNLPADSDPDGDALTVIAVTTPTMAGFTATQVAAGSGEIARFEIGDAFLVVEADGDVFMWSDAADPFPTLEGDEPASIFFSYTVHDGHGGAATANVAIDVGNGGGEASEIESLALAAQFAGLLLDPDGNAADEGTFGPSTEVWSPPSDPGVDFDAVGWENDDTVYTSFSHPGGPPAAYVGGGAEYDAVFLIFTPSQLQDILTTNADANPWRDELQDYLLDAAGDDLALGDSSWHATAAGFGSAHIGLASPAAGADLPAGAHAYLDIDTTWKSVLASENFVEGGGEPGDDLIVAVAVGALFGGDGNDVLVAIDGGNAIDGGTGIDLLLGGDGNDILIGNSGRDLLAGGPDADIFKWLADAATETPGSANFDDVADYGFIEGDKIDLSALLDAHFGPASALGDFVSVQGNGQDIDVFVDPTGTGSFATGTSQAFHLIGINTFGANDPLTVFFAGQDQVLTG